MSYTPTNWQTGDTITAEKLNHIEQGLFEAVDSIIILNDKAEPFIVTLTPTAQDLSGTMDKTVAEINAAYEAGKKIVFRVLTGASTYAEALCTNVVKNNDLYPSYGGYTIDVNNNLFIYAWTGYTNEGTKNTYSTTIYPLTPMS